MSAQPTYHSAGQVRLPQVLPVVLQRAIVHPLQGGRGDGGREVADQFHHAWCPVEARVT